MSFLNYFCFDLREVKKYEFIFIIEFKEDGHESHHIKYMNFSLSIFITRFSSSLNIIFL